MKKLITLLTITIFLSSCDNSDVKGRPIIKSKFINANKEGFCRYSYNGLGTRGQEFDDSCNKYSIGDTIK